MGHLSGLQPQQLKVRETRNGVQVFPPMDCDHVSLLLWPQSHQVPFRFSPRLIVCDSTGLAYLHFVLLTFVFCVTPSLPDHDQRFLELSGNVQEMPGPSPLCTKTYP